MTSSIHRLLVIGLCGITLCNTVTGKSEAKTGRLSLQEALHRALEHNTQLAIQQDDANISLEETIIEDATFDPTLDLSAGIDDLKSPPSNDDLTGANVLTREDQDYSASVGKELRGLGTELSLDTAFNRSTSNSVNRGFNPEIFSSVSMSISQPLLQGRGKINLAALARAKVRSRQAYLRLQENILDVIQQTVDRYWEYAFAKANLQNQQSQLEYTRTLVQETKKRVEVGLATSSELFSAQAEQAREKEQTLNRKQEVWDALDRLREVMGHLEQDSLQEKVPTASLPERDYGIPDMFDIVEKALFFDRERREQLEEMKLREIDTRVAENAQLPDLSLNASGAYLGRDDQFDNSFNNSLDRNAYRWGASLQLSFPWQQRADHARYRIAKRRQEQAESRLRNIKERIILDVREAWRELKTSMANFRTTQDVLRFSRRAHEREQARYREGLATFRETLETLRDLDEARTRALESQLRLLRAETRVERLTGELLDQYGFTWEALDSDLPPDEKMLR